MKKKSSSADKRLTALLDENVPFPVGLWLKGLRPHWVVHHTSELGLNGQSDDTIYEWAFKKQAVIITFDEDLADKRFFSTKDHPGVVRLRVWPTTIEETERALERLLSGISDEELQGALIIIDQSRIRVRSGKIKIVPSQE